MAWEVAIKSGVTIQTLPNSSVASALKADLVDGVVPLSELPASLDDVLEYAALASFPASGESGKLYIAADTSLPYRWNGSGYTPVSSSINLGETSDTAYRGDRGKTAYDHSQATGNAHGLTKTDLGLGNVSNTADADKPISTAVATALSGKADLVGGLIPSNQLPSYVDDVLEYANYGALPATGEAGKLYITVDTSIVYRWAGSTYAPTSSSLALGETSATAYRGDRGKAAYDHSLQTGNAHGLTKADISLGNVDNTADADKPISTLMTAALLNKETAGAAGIVQDNLEAHAADSALHPTTAAALGAYTTTQTDAAISTAVAAATVSSTSVTGGFIDGWSGEVEQPTATTYTIMLSAPGDCQLTSFATQLGVGTATVTVSSAGTAITALTGISVTTSKSTITVVTGGLITSGSVVTLTITTKSTDAARLSFSCTFFRKTASVLLENEISTETGTLMVDRNNIITYVGAGTYTFPTMENGQLLGVTARTAYAHVLNSGARTFLKSGGTTTDTTSTMATAEAGTGRVFRALSGNLIQMTWSVA